VASDAAPEGVLAVLVRVLGLEGGGIGLALGLAGGRGRLDTRAGVALAVAGGEGRNGEQRYEHCEDDELTHGNFLSRGDDHWRQHDAGVKVAMSRTLEASATER
jgi:hypothetical protein